MNTQYRKQLPGTKLDFFLIADGANGGTNVFSTNSSLNKDGVNHVMSYAFAVPGSSYLLISFEDMYGGGDRDQPCTPLTPLPPASFRAGGQGSAAAAISICPGSRLACPHSPPKTWPT